MNYAENIQKVRDIVNKMRYLESLDGILYCDKWFTGPKDGFPYVTKVNAYLSELRQQQLLSQEVSQLVAAVCFVVAGGILLYNRFRPHEKNNLYVNRLKAQQEQAEETKED